VGATAAGTVGATAGVTEMATAGAMVEVTAMGEVTAMAEAMAMAEATAIDPATVEAVVQLRLDRALFTAALIPEKSTSTPLRAVNNRQFADIAPLGKSRCGPGSLPSDSSRLAALEGQHLAQPSPSAEDRFLLLSDRSSRRI
jgi:hypothetical protein